MEILFTIPSMSEQKITTQLKGELHLYDTYLHLDMEFYCEEENDKTGVWDSDVLRSYDTKVLKCSIVGTCVLRNNRENSWQCAVFITGITDLVICTETEKAAREVADKVNEWLGITQTVI